MFDFLSEAVRKCSELQPNQKYRILLFDSNLTELWQLTKNTGWGTRENNRQTDFLTDILDIIQQVEVLVSGGCISNLVSGQPPFCAEGSRWSTSRLPQGAQACRVGPGANALKSSRTQSK